MTDADSSVVTAPWDDRTVRNLNRFQQLPWVHPYTCGYVGHSTAIRLCATSEGWRCADPHEEGCEYTQNWASALMADPSRWPPGPRPDLWLRTGPPADKAFAAMLHDVKVLSNRVLTALNSPSLTTWLSAIQGTEGVTTADLWCCNGNAEECVLCDVSELPYPWICQGDHEETPLNRRNVLMGATDRGRDALKATMRRFRAHDQARDAKVAESHVCETDHVTSEDEDACEAMRVAHRSLRKLVKHPDVFVDDPNALETAEVTEVVSAIQGWADETDLAFALGSFGDGYRKAQHDAQVALGLDRASVREGSEQAPDDLDLTALRTHVSRRLLAIGVERIEREWICCEPIESTHQLCVQGAAARKMLTALLTDDERSFPSTSDFLDEVMRLVQGIGEPYSDGSVLSEASVRELYTKGLLNGYREANAGVGSETLRTLVDAVVRARDRELARNRHRLGNADEARRLFAHDLGKAVDEARREERLKVLDEVGAELARQGSSSYEEIAFHNVRLWLRQARHKAQAGLDKRSNG